MTIQDVVVSQANLIMFLIMLLLLSSSIIILYMISKKIKQKTKETSEYKNTIKFLEKQKIKQVSVKADKKVKPEKKEDTRLDKVDSWNPLQSMSKRTFAYWKTWFLDKYFPGKVILIGMELTNGFHRLFTVKEKDEGFQFRGKKYLFDDESKYYNIDAKLYQFDFHESLALPIKKTLPLDKMKKDGMPIERKIPVTKIKQTLESTEGVDIEYAINPSTLQRFMTAKIAEGVMKGTQLDEFMKKLQMFLIVTMIAVLVHLALFLYGSGMLQNIKVPGILG